MKFKLISTFLLILTLPMGIYLVSQKPTFFKKLLEWKLT